MEALQDKQTRILAELDWIQESCDDSVSDYYAARGLCPKEQRILYCKDLQCGHCVTCLNTRWFKPNKFDLMRYKHKGFEAPNPSLKAKEWVIELVGRDPGAEMEAALAATFPTDIARLMMTYNDVVVSKSELPYTWYDCIIRFRQLHTNPY